MYLQTLPLAFVFHHFLPQVQSCLLVRVSLDFLFLYHSILGVNFRKILEIFLKLPTFLKLPVASMVKNWNTEIWIIHLWKSTHRFSYKIREFHIRSRKYNHPWFQMWTIENSNFQIELTPRFYYMKFRESCWGIYTKILIC